METARVYADFHNADPQGRLRLICNGTKEDLCRQGIVLREELILQLYMEDVETTGVVTFSPAEGIWVAEIDWRNVHSQAMSNDAIVVRGGNQDRENIYRCISIHPNGVTGIAVLCSTDETVEGLSNEIAHRVISTTSVTEVRAQGGDVVRVLGPTPHNAIVTMNENYDMAKACGTSPPQYDELIPSVFVDFNNLSAKDCVRLNTFGTRADLELQGIKLKDGIIVQLYDFDEFCLRGVIERDSIDGWVARFDSANLWSK